MTAGSNLLTNPGFEVATDVLYPPVASYSDVPQYWSTFEDTSVPGPYGSCAISAGDAAEGSRYARCSVNGGGAPWRFMLLQTGITVQNGHRYLIRLRARGTGAGSFALAVSSNSGGRSYIPSMNEYGVTVGTAWTDVRFDFTACVRRTDSGPCDVPIDYDTKFGLELWRGAGVVEFDDVQFVELP